MLGESEEKRAPEDDTTTLAALFRCKPVLY